MSGGRVRLISFAPERPGARKLEAYCLAHGIVPSIGHSNARRRELRASQCSHVCHLYNAQRLAVHREPGVMGHAFLEKDMYAEIIMDGFHNDPDMLELALQQKGASHLELITDSMRAKGLGDGISELGGQTVHVHGIEARLDDDTIAGSVLPFNIAFKNALRYTHATLFDAVLMSSVNQATEFKLTQKGGLTVGKDADINVLTSEYDLIHTYLAGTRV